LAAIAKAIGYAGFGIASTNTLAGAVREYVAAKKAELPNAVGCRLNLKAGVKYTPFTSGSENPEVR